MFFYLVAVLVKVKTKGSYYMGFLNYLGLDDLADSVNELTNGFDELREEIVSSVVGSGEELKSTIDDIGNSLNKD